MVNRTTKTLKFKPHLVPRIIDGTKAVTWRLFDDKGLQTGDHLELYNSENGLKFAEAEIINCAEKKIDDLTPDDLRSNDYRDQDHVLEINMKYYGEGVNGETAVKIIEFRLLPQ